MRKAVFLALAIAIAAPIMAKPTVAVGFSPSASQNALQLVLSIINSARRNIDVAAYSFTSKPAAVLVAAKNRGVAVRVAADEKSNTGKYTAVTFLANWIV